MRFTCMVAISLLFSTAVDFPKDNVEPPPRAPLPGLMLQARTVMVIKRTLNPGFAGIDNDLYYLDKTLMLFGDAKAFTTQLVKQLTDHGGGLH